MPLIKSYTRTISQERAIEIASKIYKLAEDENISYDDLFYVQLFLEDMTRHDRDTSVDKMYRSVLREIEREKKRDRIVSLSIAVIALIIAIIALTLR